ncbi:unnamed protein product [Lota lota]
MDLKHQENTANYMRTLDRIAEKYLKLTEHGKPLDVNFKHAQIRDIERYIKASELEISRMAESPSSGREYSYTDGNKTTDSQIEYQAEETNKSIESNFIMDGVSEMEQTQASGMGLLDNTQGNLVDVLVQPEDQDEELERTLSSHGSTLIELFPQMITQMGKACHRQHVFEAADSVLQRYRRMRQTNGNARKTTKPTPREGCHHLSQSCDKHNLKAVESSAAVFHSPARRDSNRTEPLQMWRAPPESEVVRVRRDEQRTIPVDFYSSKPSQATMNQTFTVSMGKRPGQSYSTALQSPAQSQMFNRSNSPYVMERYTILNSPVRQQGSFKTKWRNHEGYGGSPKAFARHSNTVCLEGHSREARYNPASPSSIHEHHSLSPKRRLYYQDCHSPSQLRSDSPRSSLAAGLPRFKRHHSFDSSLRPDGIMHTPDKIEEEFTKLYHKFVCLGKSTLSERFPCRCCAGRLEANRGRSSSSASTLSALALSPHRSNLRKRIRDLDQQKFPMSKRPREWTSSPGSLRHCKARRLHL